MQIVNLGWESVASDLLAATNAGFPVDAMELAALCGLHLAPWSRPTGALSGQTVLFPRTARHVRRQGIVAHELAHWALQREHLEDTEDAAHYVARALMLPYHDIMRATESGVDLRALMRRYPNTSAEMIGLRLVGLRAKSAVVCDVGRERRWAGTADPALAAVVDQARASKRPASSPDGVRKAWPIGGAPWLRVVALTL